MTVTLKQPVMICLAAVSFSCAVASGQQPQSGNATAQSRPTTLPAQSGLAPDRLFVLASPAVVKLTIKDEDDREIGVASGFIVRFDKKKHDIQGQALDGCGSTIITNYHVIRPAIDIDVSFSDGHTEQACRVLAEDQAADLAVLSLRSSVEPKQALILRDGPSPPIGTKVYAIGSPQGLSNTLSEGLISGYRQRGKHEPWIQITAPISPGSSGGPLLSPEGSVLGVTTAFLRESQNLNFAVPASEVTRLLTHVEKPRLIWQGASIRETEKYAFLGAEFAFSIVQFSQANPKGVPDGQVEQTFEEFQQQQERFQEEQLTAGDQLALLLKGRELYLSRQYTEAIGMLGRATKAEPGEYAYLAHYALAQAIEGYMFTPGGRKTEFKSVIDPLTRAKELNPDFGPTFYSLCRIYQFPNADPEMNMYPEILLAADSLVRLMPRCYHGYRFRGEVWAELGREEAFERDFETALALRPNDRDLLIAKGGGYLSLGQLQKAVDQYRDVIKLDGDYVLGHLNLANALQRMGKYDEAIKAYQRADKTVESANVELHNHIERSIAECRRQMMKSP